MNFIMTYQPFLPQRIKLEKVKRLVANLHHKTEYDMQVRNLKTHSQV